MYVKFVHNWKRYVNMFFKHSLHIFFKVSRIYSGIERCIPIDVMPTYTFYNSLKILISVSWTITSKNFRVSTILLFKLKSLLPDMDFCSFLNFVYFFLALLYYIFEISKTGHNMRILVKLSLICHLKLILATFSKFWSFFGPWHLKMLNSQNWHYIQVLI